MGKNLFGVRFVVGDVIKPNETLLVSGAKMTHEENLTTGEKKKIIEWIDAVKTTNTKTGGE